MLQKADPNMAVIVSSQGVGAPAVMPRNQRAYISEGYRLSKTVFRVVGHIARAGSGIKWKHYTDQSKKREITDPNDPLMMLWNRPSKRVAGTAFREAMLAYYCITGNNYILGINANQNPNPLAPFDELYNLRPDLTKIHVTDDGPDYYEFGNFQPPKRYADAFIMHSKLFAGNDDVYGLSPVEVAAMLVDIQKAGQKWNLGLMSNMARPGGAWVTDALLGDVEYKGLKEEIRKKFAGPRNAGETAILHGGVKWQSMSMSPYELDWLESDTKGDKDIAGIFFNYPTFLLGIQDATFNNQAEAKHFLYTDIIFPILDKYVDHLNFWLTPRYGGYLDYDHEDVETIQDIIQAAKAAASDRAAGEYQVGTSTFLETRETQGKPKLAGVKDFILLQGMPIPIDKINNYVEAQVEKALAPPPPPPAPVLQALPNQTIVTQDTTDPTDADAAGNNDASADNGGKSLKYLIAGIYQPDDLDARLAAYEAQGVVSLLWKTDEYPCDVCILNEGKVVALGKPFPSGHILPKAHPHCDCTVMPVLFKSMQRLPERASSISRDHYRELLRKQAS